MLYLQNPWSVIDWLREEYRNAYYMEEEIRQCAETLQVEPKLKIIIYKEASGVTTTKEL